MGSEIFVFCGSLGDLGDGFRVPSIGSFSFSLNGVLHHCLFSKIGVNGVLDLWSRVLNFWWGLGISVVLLVFIIASPFSESHC